jgi:hypothetical protein
LAFHRSDDLWMTMPHQRHPKPRREVDVPISVCVDDVRANRLDPHDRVVVCAGSFASTFPSCRQRRALARGQAFDPGAADGRRDRLLNGRKRVSRAHAAVLARSSRAELQLFGFQG